MEKAIIVIDYSNDFVATNGALTCGKAGQAIEDTILHYIESGIKEGDSIFFLMDHHYPNDSYHPEHKLFPSHNLDGSPGRELYGKINKFYESHRDSPQVYWINKTRYSSFAGTNLHQLLQERRIHEVVLLGVCTDICILHTAVDAYNLGYQITVVSGGVASFDQNGHTWALGHFKNALGATVAKNWEEIQ